MLRNILRLAKEPPTHENMQLIADLAFDAGCCAKRMDRKLRQYNAQYDKEDPEEVQWWKSIRNMLMLPNPQRLPGEEQTGAHSPPT
jgi:hypothetical protein